MTMMGISNRGLLATDRVAPTAQQCQKLHQQELQTRQNTRINLAKAKVLPQQTRLMYFLAVAQDDAVCRNPLRNFPANR
jgi:hypothetical protein